MATSSGEAELYAAVSVMKDMILIERALSFIGISAKMELSLDSSAARAILERQGAGRLRHVEVAVLWAQQWVKDRGVSVRAEPTRTNCADLGTKVHSVARFRELLDMIKLIDRYTFEAEASKETLPMPLHVAGVAQGSSPLASLITFLSSLVTHGEAREFFLDMGSTFQGMFLVVGIGVLLGVVVGICHELAGRKSSGVTWMRWFWKPVAGETLELRMELSMRR